MRSKPIEDYAIIGDGRSAALVSRSGSIDWLCWPRFDSPSLFGALLDAERGGTWSIAPRDGGSRTRTYVGDSAILESVFTSDQSEITITDAMPIASPEDVKTLLVPEHELVRVVVCKRGTTTVDVRFAPRPHFASRPCTILLRGKLGARVETPDGLLTLRTDAPVAASIDRTASGDDTLRWTIPMSAGDAVHFVLTWTVDAPAILSPLGEWTRGTLDRTRGHWQRWSDRTHFEGADRAQVVRSAITVRLLAYAPSGAIIAAPTTSLPESIGGTLNWDYRYCWIRDAAFTVRSLVELGHMEEAIGYAHWLLHATRLTQPRLMVLYDVFGRPPSRESKISTLEGYGASKPVRVGNGADGQLQLDSYGEVVDAVWRLVRAGMPLDREQGTVIEGFGRYVCEHWQEPDAGIWEPRGAPLRHTHSLVLCWTALDKLIDLQKSGHLRARHRVLFETARKAMAEAISSRAYNHALQSYTATLDGHTLDATSLLLGWCGFETSSSPRMRSTFDRILAELSPRAGMLYRNRVSPDGSPSEKEGAFGVCSFWIAEHLARGGGTLADARQAFGATASYANDVGLMAEEIDPETGHALGNFPQTFTHVGLLNAALSIEARARGEVPR